MQSPWRFAHCAITFHGNIRVRLSLLPFVTIETLTVEDVRDQRYLDRIEVMPRWAKRGHWGSCYHGSIIIRLSVHTARIGISKVGQDCIPEKAIEGEAKTVACRVHRGAIRPVLSIALSLRSRHGSTACIQTVTP